MATIPPPPAVIHLNTPSYKSKDRTICKGVRCVCLPARLVAGPWPARRCTQLAAP